MSLVNYKLCPITSLRLQSKQLSFANQYPFSTGCVALENITIFLGILA